MPFLLREISKYYAIANYTYHFAYVVPKYNLFIVQFFKTLGIFKFFTLEKFLIPYSMCKSIATCSINNPTSLSSYGDFGMDG